MNSKGNSESLKGLLLVWTRLYVLYYTTQTWMVAYGSSVPDFTMARRCSMVRCKLKYYDMLNFTRNQDISPNWLKVSTCFNCFNLIVLSHQGFNTSVHIAESLANVALLFQERLRFGQGISQVLGRSSAQVHDVCACAS